MLTILRKCSGFHINSAKTASRNIEMPNLNRGIGENEDVPLNNEPGDAVRQGQRNTELNQNTRFKIMLCVIFGIIIGAIIFGISMIKQCPSDSTEKNSSIDSNMTDETTANNTEAVDVSVPNDFRPIKQSIYIVPQFPEGGNNVTVIGNITTEFECTTPTNKIIINPSCIKDTVKLWLYGSAKSQHIQRIDIDDKNKKTIVLDKPLLKERKYNMFVKITESFKRWNAVDISQFYLFNDPTSIARSTINVGLSEGWKSFSNMPKTTKLIGNTSWDSYEETPPIYTKDISSIIVPSKLFHQIANTSKESPWNINGYGPSSLSSQMTYINNLMSKIFEACEKLCDLSFRFKKVDIIVMQSQSPGIIVNFGLIKIRESLLILPNSTMAEKRAFASELVAAQSHHLYIIVCPESSSDCKRIKAACTHIISQALYEIFPEFSEHSDGNKVDIGITADYCKTIKAHLVKTNKS